MKLLTLLPALLLASPALAAPALRASVEISGPIVTVGDMFDAAGGLADTPLFRAPAPGTTGLVSLAAVRQAAARIGLVDYEAGPVAQVRVSRSGIALDVSDLCDLIAARLAADGEVGPDVSAECRFDPPVAFTAAAVDEPARLLELRYRPAGGGFAVRFEIAGLDHPVEASGTMSLSVEVPHLAATHAAGTILTPADIEMKRVPLRFAEATGIADIEQLVGMALARNARAGLMLRASDVSEPLAVQRSALVNVTLRTGPMRLTVTGQALNDAAVGQPVAVMNLNSKKILHGVATPGGGVEITGGPLTVAGL